MQYLLIQKTLRGDTVLYCPICDVVFNKEFVEFETETALELHRKAHTQYNLATPEFYAERIEIHSNPFELYTVPE